MRVTELVENVARMIYLTRASVRGDTTVQFIVGNLRLVDHGPPPFSPLHVRDHILIEVSIGDTPVEVWKIHRGQQFSEIAEEGQALIAIHAIFGHLVISEEYQALKSHIVTVAVVQEDPAYGPEWKPTVFALAGPQSQTLSFECFTNTMWRTEVFDSTRLNMAASSAIPVVSSSGQRGGSSFERHHRNSARGGMSVSSSHGSAMYNQSPPLGPQQPGSFQSSNRYGVSPTTGSFHAALASMTTSQMFPQQQQQQQQQQLPSVVPSAVPIHVALSGISFLGRIEMMRKLPVMDESSQFEDDDFVVTMSTYDAQQCADVDLEEDLQEF